jgi:3-methyl-2-oxobutanoate hydroxymethyltransferase
MSSRLLPSLGLVLRRSGAAPVTATFLSRRLPAAAASAAHRPSPYTQCRSSSHSPISPTAIPPRKKVTINTLRNLHEKKSKIAMVTAHDFPSGLAADLAGVDMVLVGDSLAMVALGMEVGSTLLMIEGEGVLIATCDRTQIN